MTDDTMDLRALVGKSPDADFLREMIGFAATRLMKLQVGALTGASYGEKNAQRVAQRNGYRDRDCETRAGTVDDTVTSSHSAATQGLQDLRNRCSPDNRRQSVPPLSGSHS